MQTEELVAVTILIPKQHVKSAYDWASSLLGESVLPKSGTPVSSGSVGSEEPPINTNKWTAELIRRQFVESSPFMQRFEKLLAAEPGRKFSTFELATRFNAENGWKSVVGALGAYGRRVVNRYKMATWPFKAEKNHVDGLFYYWIDADDAETVKIIAGL